MIWALLCDYTLYRWLGDVPRVAGTVSHYRDRSIDSRQCSRVWIKIGQFLIRGVRDVRLKRGRPLLHVQINPLLQLLYVPLMKYPFTFTLLCCRETMFQGARDGHVSGGLYTAKSLGKEIWQLCT